MTQADISNSLVALVKGAAPDAQVWNRFRVGITNEEQQRLYAKNGIGKVWFIRRVAVRNEITEMSDLISETHVFELRYARSLLDTEDNPNNRASEILFQQEIEAVRAAVNADKHLGFDAGVNHQGLVFNEMPLAAQLGAYEMHMAVGTIDVWVSDC